MARIETAAKAKAMQIAITAATGERPLLVHHAEYSALRFGPLANARLRQRFEAQMGRVGAGPPADVRIDMIPIVGPYIGKRVAATLVIAAGVGFLLGRL